jgi:hypothetical protein
MQNAHTTSQRLVKMVYGKAVCHSPSELPSVTTSGAPLLPLLLLLSRPAAALLPLLLPVAGAGAKGGAVLRTNTLQVQSPAAV